MSKFKKIRRSFRDGKAVHSISLENCWWEAFDAICPKDDVKRWVLIWIAEAQDKGIPKGSLIRYRIHEQVLEYAPRDTEPILPLLASIISVKEAQETRCPFPEEERTYLCKVHKCKHWHKDYLRGFGKCLLLEKSLKNRSR